MKNRQGLTIAALIVAIIGLSIGFAAFSNTLTISSSASVNPSDENFIVQFSKVSDADQTGSSYQIVPSSETYGDNATINSSNKKLLEGVHAKFTAPGQSVTYTLYVRNTGAYVAYLKELQFANATNATGSETYKHCYAATEDSNGDDIPTANQATGTLVTQACNGIGISVSIGTAGPITPDSVSKSLGNQALQANGGNVQAIITISYDSNASYVDGPMEVEFGDISFNASSNPGTSQQQEQGNQGGNEQGGGQEETQQLSDDLIPTDTEKEEAYHAQQNGSDQYLMVDNSKDGIAYYEMGSMGYVELIYNNVVYFWYCDSNTATAVSTPAGFTVEAKKWYIGNNGVPTSLYTESSPINAESFNTVRSQTYLTRVINSFSNNG